jgi:hypothetical protein
MKHTEVPSVSDASLTPLTSKPKRSFPLSFVANLVDALHASRRLQAARVIRQHRHLVHEERGQTARRKAEAKSREDQAPRIVPEAEPEASKPKAAMSVKATLLIAIAVAGFGILHAIADGALRHAPAPQPTEDSMPLPNRD